MTSASASEKRIVFILDDEPAMRDLVRTCLDDAFEVLEFGDVDAAVAALETHAPDLIFLDLELGTGDAIEAMRAFAERGYAGAVQLMSGRGEAVLEGVQTAGERHGFRFLPPLPKPFRLSRVRKAVEEFKAFDPPQPSSGPAQSSPTPAARSSFSLDEALEQDWLELWYQPKFDLQTGRIAGAEGLIRARHPVHGIVAPFAFLAGASDEALSKLTERVLLSALRDWESFHEASLPLLLAVNLPASALLTTPLAQIVRQNRPKAGAWPGLVLEVTEDQILESIPLAQEVAAQLQIYDIRLSLDDFGQGYSSLARLRDLPFQELKTDRTFVLNCSADPAKRDLCQTIVDMAHRFGCKVVAEGIETAEELVTIKATGCDYGQGYLLARPMAKDDLIRRLSESSP